jgi:hypothetical protein
VSSASAAYFVFAIVNVFCFSRNSLINNRSLTQESNQNSPGCINYDSNEEKCIFLSQPHNNEVYANTIGNCESQEIYPYHDSIENKVDNNTLTNATEGIEEIDDSQDDKE